MTDKENETYCPNGINTYNSTIFEEIEERPLLPIGFKEDFMLRIYLAGCYYLNKTIRKWESYGMEILEDSNFTFAHCQSNHLTSFIGDFIVLPSAIDFSYVFANASFERNPTIYVTIIIVSILYILFAVTSRYMDYRDSKKVGYTFLNDNKLNNNYFYEFIVFTGNRKNAATKSKVSFIMTGEFGDTGVRNLIETRRDPFRRAGVDSFIVSTKFALGNLSYMKIWHDNQGKSKEKSWFLKYVIVHDLQTRKKNYFLCQKWLACEKGDGQISRVLPLAGQKQKTELKYLLSKQTKQKISDGHMWLSIFARPVQSSFTRLERVTCCFVLLYVSMLANIIYYGGTQDAKNGGLEIGPFFVTPEQVFISIFKYLKILS